MFFADARYLPSPRTSIGGRLKLCLAKGKFSGTFWVVSGRKFGFFFIMYGIFTYISYKDQPNVGIQYTIHESFGEGIATTNVLGKCHI